MNTIEETADRLKEIVGMNFLAYLKLKECNLEEAYIPPTREEFIKKYQHNWAFNWVVNNIVCYLLKEIRNETD